MLTLSNTSLSEIDSQETFWESCHELSVVNLLHNKLRSIPDQLLNHKQSLRIVALSFNNFDYIPRALFECHALENLNLIQNQLAIVPRDICGFENLKDLFLDNNSIRMLPDELDKLVHLRVLGLSSNLLTSLPPSFSKLHSLHRLELHHNHFKFFPSVLYSTEFCSPEPKLRTLTLNNNRIQVVPEEAKHLINYLTHFTIDNTAKPIQIGDGPPNGILRILVLGKSGSGKSSLVKVLVDQDKYITPVDKEVVDHTIGINQYSYTFKNKITDKVYAINLWDFAGEKCYAMMNQIFLSPGCLVWLVFDMSKYVLNDRKHFEDTIGTWFRAIIARIGTSVVWIIGTHADKCPQAAQAIKANVEKLTLEMLDYVKQHGDDGNTYSHAELDVKIITDSKQFFVISNAHDLEGHNALRSKIEELPMHVTLSASFEELKPHWLSSEERLLELTTQKMSKLDPPITHKKDVRTLLKEPADINSFLNYLHIRGEIYIYGEIIYLDIVWLISLLREIFRSDICEHQLRQNGCNTCIENGLNLFTSTGTIKEDLLLELWKPMGVSKGTETIDLLVKFNIAFEIVTSGCNSRTFMFPWYLTETNEDKITFANIYQLLPLKGQYIILLYEFDFIPPTFFEQLLSCCSQSIPALNIKRHKMIAYHNNLLVSVLWMPKDGHPYTGYVTFVVTDEEPAAIPPNNAGYDHKWSVMEQLIEGFPALLNTWKGMHPVKFVACPLCVQSQEHQPHKFDFMQHDQKTVHCNLRSHKVSATMISPPKCKCLSSQYFCILVNLFYSCKLFVPHI